jgi:type IV fimbrial biogenesis protein FimT
MDKGAYRGFTLWELLVTVTVAGIILGLGVPNFREFQRNNAIIAAGNELVSGLYLARTEAVKRQVPMTLCGSANPLAAAPACGGGGNGGFIVFVDENGNGVLTDPTDGNAVVDANETVLAQRAAPGGTINVYGDGGQYITIAPTGFAVPIAQGQAQGRTTTVLYCDERGNKDVGGRSSARVVTIAPTGRPQTLQETADVTTAVGVTGGVCP